MKLNVKICSEKSFEKIDGNEHKLTFFTDERFY